MRRRSAAIVLTLLLGVALATPISAALAQGDDYGLNETYTAATGEQPPANPDPLPQTLGLIINWTLGLLGFVFLMLMIWAGIGWMTAGGNEEKVTKAKTMINAAIAGMVVVFISYALADAIVAALSAASNTG
ncbi:MAG: hypothetical protein G01um101431_627 [Parcubacteria group bacterium Gr01-1014_31]|nr:MAG: hypothetical protein G01um101431_627 [Parcubacteria group bacterium Gr01-1014_31]